MYFLDNYWLVIILGICFLKSYSFKDKQYGDIFRSLCQEEVLLQNQSQKNLDIWVIFMLYKV